MLCAFAHASSFTLHTWLSISSEAKVHHDKYVENGLMKCDLISLNVFFPFPRNPGSFLPSQSRLCVLGESKHKDWVRKWILDLKKKRILQTNAGLNRQADALVLALH